MKMKKWIAAALMATVWMACQEQEAVSEFTGNETTYALTAGSAYAVSGTLTLKERKDGFTSVVIELTGTDGLAKHPVHLHRGTIATPGAEVAALLAPVDASTGKSETLLTQLADETPVRYADLGELEACIKIHLSDVGEGRDVILAGGNIGASFTKTLANGRQQAMEVCKSE